MLSCLSERQADLSKLLLTKNWRDYEPQIPDHTKKLLSNKNVKCAWNILDDWVEDWPGSISKPGFMQFLTKGFISFQRPGGFIAFIFSPLRLTSESKKDRSRNIRWMLNDKVSISEADIAFDAEFDYFLPMTVQEGETKIKMAILFLEKLTTKRGIASSAFFHAKWILNQYQNQIFETQQNNNMFMTRYINLVDSIFNSFCAKLYRLQSTDDPIWKAKRQLKT